MNKTFSKPLLAGVATLLLASQAVASSQMQAAVSHVQMGVIDLTPDDGVAAGFTVASNYMGLIAEVYDAHNTYDGHETGNGVTATAGFGGISAQAWRYDGGMAGSTAATGVQPVQYGASFVSRNTIAIDLAAHSLFTFSGDYAVSPSVDPASNDLASSKLTVTLGNHDFGFGQRWEASATENFSDRFWLGYANDTDAPMRVYLDVYLRGNLDGTPSTLSPVPEPASYLMFAAGLGLLGWGVRRGRRA